MARHRRAEALEEDEPELDISSLIDICFLLLIYFLVTTTIKKKERDLDMALPSAAPSDQQPDIQPMFIKIDVNGSIYLNSGAAQEILDTDTSSREVPQLTQRLEMYASAARAADSQPLVQLYVEGDAKQQRVVDVLNALAKEKIEKVTFTDLIDAE
jgi:biopolymer transport protein ExbD